MLLKEIKISKILFLDIETVAQIPRFNNLSPDMQALWLKKADRIARREYESAEELYDKAGIWAEFGKIVCISVGYLTSESAEVFKVKSFAGHDEKVILLEFSRLLSHHFSDQQSYLCAHNGKEFDFPYIARRMVVNGIEIPEPLNHFGKKPWEVKHLDTLELWKFGDHKHYTSLELICAVLDIPTPKDDLDGGEVNREYWEKKNLEKIANYCEKDTIAVCQVLLRYLGKQLIKTEKIIRATPLFEEKLQ